MASICGTCDCNLWFIVGWLIGMICGVLVNIVLEEAERRKKAKE